MKGLQNLDLDLASREIMSTLPIYCRTELVQTDRQLKNKKLTVRKHIYIT